LYATYLRYIFDVRPNLLLLLCIFEFRLLMLDDDVGIGLGVVLLKPLI